MEAEVLVAAYPRVHFGLVDLGFATPRAYGGAGASFSGPPSHTIALPANRFDLVVHSDSLREKVSAALRRAEHEGLNTRVSITIADTLPTHIGYGSGTATVLSALLATAHSRHWPTTESDLIRLSGRGRTSGVGCTTFFRGGFALDAGQTQHPSDGMYRPSHDPHGRPPSTRIGSWPVPSTWRLTMVLPHHNQTLSSSAESEFFRRATPVSSHDVLQQLSHLYHGMLPAVIDGDLHAFGTNLREFQRRGFKEAEIEIQMPMTKELITAAWDVGLAAGLSSLGPAVFVVHDHLDTAGALGLNLKNWHTEGPYTFRNDGAMCEVMPR